MPAIKRKDYTAPPNPHEAAIIAGATEYAAYLFISRNQVFSIPCPDQPGAEREAQRLADHFRKPAIVYAIRGEQQAFLKNVRPA
jgi:hypothetical protein